MADETRTCAVCGEEADEKTSDVCHSCGKRFHLNKSSDRPGKDCGSVWVNDWTLSLEYACQRCLDAAKPPPPSKPSVIRPRLGRRRYRRRA